MDEVNFDGCGRKDRIPKETDRLRENEQIGGPVFRYSQYLDYKVGQDSSDCTDFP